MPAFAPSVLLRGSLPSRTRVRAQCSIRPRMCETPADTAAGNGASAPRGADYVQRAIDKGGALRDELEASSVARKKAANKTEESIAKMSAALDAIMEKIRVETGEVGPPAAPRESAPAPPPAAAAPTQEQSVPSVTDDSEPYTDPSMFGMDSTAGWQVLANTDSLPNNQEDVKFRIECDVNGCSIIQMDADAAPGPGVRQKYVLAGRGFRVGYDPEAPDSFCGMVGNEQWLLAMGKREITHFKRLCLALRKKMDRIERGEEDPPVKKPAVRRSGDGMFNERVGRTGSECSVELESKLMWVQAFGQPKLGQFGIRAIFMEGRQSEGYWAPEVVPNLLAAVAKLSVD